MARADAAGGTRVRSRVTLQAQRAKNVVRNSTTAVDPLFAFATIPFDANMKRSRGRRAKCRGKQGRTVRIGLGPLAIFLRAARLRQISRGILHCAALALATVILAATFSGPALAQGPGCTFFAPCPAVPAANGNVFVSSQAGLMDIGSHFQNRLGAIATARTAATQATIHRAAVRK
jgi:hypothetical protein